MENQDWFEQFINDFVMGLVGGVACGGLPNAKEPIETYLKDLGLYDEICKSPLVKVTGKDDESLTLLIRGEFPLFSGSVTAFMRIEVEFSTTLTVKAGTLNIDILDWVTVIGDVTLKKENVFEARLAFGYDERDGEGVFRGAGALKVIPANFGLDVALGGLDERGAVLGLKIDSPVAIPLGSTGLGLKAIGGDFAYNFIACLDYKGSPVPSPNAADYVDWAANASQMDKWKPGPRNLTAVGVGVRTDIVTVADQGRLIKLTDAGLAVLTPGPIFILGGAGDAMMGVAKAKGYLALDFANPSIAFGLGTLIQVPPDSGDLIKGGGQIDAFFSFVDPALWYLYFGRVEEQLNVRAIRELFGANAYYMVDNHLMQFGGGLRAGFDWSWWVIRLWAQIGVEARARIGWNPPLLGAWFKLWAELGFKFWFIKLALQASAEAGGVVANPCELMFKVGFTVDLPWPIPDVGFSADVSFSDETPKAPELSLVLAEAKRQSGTDVVTVEKLGAIHPVSGRQWLLGQDKAWPDLDIVVPFRTRVIDSTPDKVVVGSVVSSENQGGYDVRHELTSVVLENLVTQSKETIHGVWADDQSGSRTARLHLLGMSPYDWLSPHITPALPVVAAREATRLQGFGHGKNEHLSEEHRFGEMLVKPVTPTTSADLLNEFSPPLSGRVLACKGFQVRFATTDGSPIHVDRLQLYVIAGERASALVKCGAQTLTPTKEMDLYGGVWLGRITLLDGNAQIDRLEIHSGGKGPLFVYGALYREKRKLVQPVRPDQVLKPGRYRLTMKGRSKGTPPAEPEGLPETALLGWEFSKEFEVVYPERLRPYILHATIGDRRIFGKETHWWNPTMYGYGFPHYRQYEGVVRFKVSYLSSIFESANGAIAVRVDYDDQETPAVQQAATFELADGSSALQVVKDWVTANAAGSGVNLTDQEIVLAPGLPAGGAVHFSIWYSPAGGTAFILDEWTACVSRFHDFEDHLDLDSDTVETTYDENGKTVHDVGRMFHKIAAPRAREKARYGTGGQEAVKAARRTAEQPLLEVVMATKAPRSLPVEYTAIPAGWALPSELVQCLDLGDVASESRPDTSSGVCFGRFAFGTGASFTGLESGVASLNDVAGETTVEAVTDADECPYALWLRTPEPIDWRRVSAALRVTHVLRADGVPVGYATRSPLDMEVRILPSPDGSSAFLAGCFAGTCCRMPAGEYELSLTFEQSKGTLPELRPGPGVDSPEIAVLKFMQPHGLDWPLPSQPGGLQFIEPAELLVALWWIPELLPKAAEGPLTREEYAQLASALGAARSELDGGGTRRATAASRVALVSAARESSGHPPRPEALEHVRQLLEELRPVVRRVSTLRAEIL